jgi:hypothetical protein
VDGLTIAGIGDPRFTPDKDTAATDAITTAGSVQTSGEQLATLIRQAGGKVDIALVHDPVMAQPVSGTCPLVLAGHVHERQVRMLDPVPGSAPTRLLVEGSTGGAGLRGLERQEPLPLAMSVLYFDEQRQLKAYDDIKVGGTGQAQVTLERKVVDAAADAATAASPTPEPTQGQ